MENEKFLMSVYDYAEKRGISHTTAYTMIHGAFNKKTKVMTKAPSIVPEKIGNTLYIDWNKYGEVPIEETNKGRKKAV